MIVRISGNLINRDREWKVIEGFLLQVHGQEKAVVGTYLISGVIRLFKEELPSDKGGLMAKDHFVCDAVQREGRVELCPPLINT